VLTRLTFVSAIDQNPVWTNDGHRIVFASLRPGGAGELYSQAADGSGAVEQLTKRGLAQFPYGMTLDGTGLVIREATTAAQDGGDLALLPVRCELGRS
jgi:Tol biopolymer transport system component